MRNLGVTLVPHEYTATFIRNGSHNHKNGTNSYSTYTTALVADVKDEHGAILADHLWLVGKIWKIVRLCTGDIVSFKGTPYRYIKGYSGNGHERTDFEIDVGLRNVHVNGICGKDPNINEILARYNITEEDELNDIIMGTDVPEEEYLQRVNDQYKEASDIAVKRRELRKAAHSAKRKGKRIKRHPVDFSDDDCSFQKFTHRKKF